jgi:cytochrome c556
MTEVKAQVSAPPYHCRLKPPTTAVRIRGEEMKRVFRKRAAVVSAVALIGCLAGPVGLDASEAKRTGVVKERHELMERFEELTERLFAMRHGELTYDAEIVRKAAAEIKAGAGSHLVKLFPEGSGGAPSDALPTVWQNKDFFAHLADRLGDIAAVLEKDAGTKPEGATSLPKKWEDVPIMGAAGGPGGMMGQGRGPMMGQGMMGRGMMGTGPGMMAGGAVESDLWHLAHVCNTCHADFRKKE